MTPNCPQACITGDISPLLMNQTNIFFREILGPIQAFFTGHSLTAERYTNIQVYKYAAFFIYISWGIYFCAWIASKSTSQNVTPLKRNLGKPILPPIYRRALPKDFIVHPSALYAS